MYWKRELEECLSAAESGELVALERENMKTIEEVYQRLREDDWVQAWIEKIKPHE